MARRRRREIEVYSLSFLDCICCGFGAIILLFVISMGSDRLVSNQIRSTLEEVYQRAMNQLELAQASKQELTKRYGETENEKDKQTKRKTELQTELETLLAQIKDAESARDKLVADIETLGETIDQREQEPEVEIEPNDPDLPIGIPVTSEYLVFVIDTSGSMRDPNAGGQMWRYVVRRLYDTFEAYPIVKGIQVLDANGNFIYGGTSTWIPDSTANRQLIYNAVRNYQYNSRSNPVPGIVKAIQLFGPRGRNPTENVGIFIFGDEYDGNTEPIIDRLERVNPRDANGERPVIINAVGFPHVVNNERLIIRSGEKFANLMRELTWRHGGAFIGVDE